MSKVQADFLGKRYKKEKRGHESLAWYKEEAFIYFNQALWRHLRHKNDYGKMICFGIDFKNYSSFSKLINPNKKFIRLEQDNKYFYF